MSANLKQMFEACEAAGLDIVGFDVAPDVWDALQREVATEVPLDHQATTIPSFSGFRIYRSALLSVGCVSPIFAHETTSPFRWPL